MRFLFAIAILVAPLLPASAQPAPQSTAGERAEWGPFGIDLSGMDPAVRPGDDFWEFANGAWARQTVIPADRAGYGQVARLGDLASSQVRVILDGLKARRATLRGDERRVADYWTALSDLRAIERRGRTPLDQELAPVREARTHRELALAMGHLVRGWRKTPFLGRIPRYSPSLFSLSVEQDSKQPSRYIAELHQSGLGMPNREYYLQHDPASIRAQAAYLSHLQAMLRLVGVPKGEASRQAGRIYDFERQIAEDQWPRLDTNDPDKSYNLMALSQLRQVAPGYDWAGFLAGAGFADRRTVIVGEPSAFARMSETFRKTPLEVLKYWLAVRLAKDRATVLPLRFAREEYAFSGGILGGTNSAPSRWQQAVELANVALADAVSRPYVERHFRPATKAALEALVANIISTMDRRLRTLEWMQPQTRAKARAKLKALRVMIGYPDRWRSYEGLLVRPDDAYGNFRRADQFEFAFRRSRIDAPADRWEWPISPTTANAFSMEVNGQITFAAAYLQPPHYDPMADPAVNYGAIGWVIGHEISHHFDNTGTRYDADGKLGDWWTPADVRAFQERSRRLIEQYDSYEALPGLRVRGAQTVGENIADLSGLAIAYDAYRASLGGREPPVLAGLSGDQRFFLGRAQMHRSIMREPEIRRGVISSNYAPQRQRAWSVRNHDAWYNAFAVTPGDRLYLPPDKRVKIW